MKVLLLKDVINVGMAGTIVSVADGYAQNFLFPRKLAREVTKENEAGATHIVREAQQRKEIIATKTSMLAERIKSLTITLRCKMHDGDRLYGAVHATDLMPLLANEGISVSKNQIVFEKVIKTKGAHQVTIKLSNTLRPSFTLKIIPQ